MKQIEDLQQEIDLIINNIADQELTERQIKNFRIRVLYLKDMIKYLESHPKEEFLKNESERISTLIKSKQSQFDDWKTNAAQPQRDPKKYRIQFEKEVGIMEFKKQLKTINYLLS